MAVCSVWEQQAETGCTCCLTGCVLVLVWHWPARYSDVWVAFMGVVPHALFCMLVVCSVLFYCL